MAKVTFTIHKAGKHQRHSRRNQILDAAQRCFKKQGFHKTTLRDIAQEFGMSAGHIYNYFSNKEAIIEALVELRTQEFLDMIDTDKFADLPPEERMDKELGQVVDAYLNLDNTSLSIAIMNEALINPKVYEIVVAAASKVRNHIVEAQLLAMKEERRYAPPYEVIESRCMTIRAMLEGLRLAHIFTPEMDVPLVREMAIKQIRSLLHHGGRHGCPRYRRREVSGARRPVHARRPSLRPCCSWRSRRRRCALCQQDQERTRGRDGSHRRTAHLRHQSQDDRHSA